MNYPYQKDISGVHYPLIDLLISYKNNSTRLFSLVDSGASISIFRPEVALMLGLKIETGKKIEMGGVGGKISGYLHQLRLDIAGKILSAPVVFSHQYEVSFNLLGREEVFKHFQIIFEENKLQTRFEK